MGGVAVDIGEVSTELSVQIRKRMNANFELDVAFSVPQGISILFGASGAGKTTLLDCVAGLVSPDSGRIAVGELVFTDAGKSIPVRNRRIGYVFQDLALFPHLSVEENIEYGLAGLSSQQRKQASGSVMESFRIDHLKERKPANISGGERQRVALARALVTDPRVLLLDEPLAALDAKTKSKIVDDLRDWNREHRIPVLYVTHSRDEVFVLGERVLVMEGGRIIAQGAPHRVMTAPQQETTAQLAGLENLFDVVVTAANQDRGTMTCRLSGSDVELETPLVRAEVGASLRLGISAGDILLATVHPEGLSARNILAGKMISLEQRDVIVEAQVNCGVEMEVHLTLAARDALQLQPGREVWLVLKTHSCHLMAANR